MTDLSAAATIAMVHATSVRLADAATELSRLDAVAGDGDHGVNVAAAFAAADAMIAEQPPSDAANVFLLVGRAFEESASGSAGALFGAFFGALGKDLIRASSPTAVEVVEALDGATAQVARLGRVGVGDKTMLDALRPAVEAARASVKAGGSLESMLAAASAAAAEGAEATAGMPARAGRARYAPDGAIGTRDPGAVTIALLFEAWANARLSDRPRPVEASS